MNWTTLDMPKFDDARKKWIVKETAPSGHVTLHEYDTEAQAQEQMKEKFLDMVMKEDAR